MAFSEAIIDFEPTIWARLIQAPKAPIAPEAARYLLSIDFTEADHARMRELMEKSGDGVLIAEEKAEPDGYVKIANACPLCMNHLSYDQSITLLKDRDCPSLWERITRLRFTKVSVRPTASQRIRRPEA